MLAVDSSLSRPRLELAFVLFKSGDYEGAKYHFEKVLSSVDDEGVKTSIKSFLNRIKEELPQFTFSLAIVSDTNPNQETSSKKLLIGSFEFELDSASSDKSDNGIEIKLGTKTPINNKERVFVKANVEHTQYSESNNTKTYLSAALGKHISLGLDSSITPEIGHHKFIYKSKSLFSGNTLGINYFKRIDNLSLFELDGRLLDYNYPDYSHMNGLKKSLVAQYTYHPNSNSQYKFQLNNFNSDAKDKSLAYKQTGFLVNNIRDIYDGWIVGLTAKLNNKNYEKVDPFFGVTRDDKEKTIELSLINSKFDLYGMSPKLILGKIDNKSNISLYEFDRTYTKLEFTKEF